MVGIFSRKGKSRDEFLEDISGDYISVTEDGAQSIMKENKDLEVRVFVLDNYDATREILDSIRGEKTICLVDIHLLRNKDPDELRRAVDKLKKTSEAVEGEIVGFHENWVLTVPKNVEINKGSQ